MEELLQTIVEQNERLLAALTELADDISEIKFNISSVHDELQWHKELSMAAQIIKAIEDVAEAVREER